MAYVVVPNEATKTSAGNSLQAAGADLDFVEFVIYQTDTDWIRDYGPRFIFADDERVIVDVIYGTPRPLDDAFPTFLASDWGEPVLICRSTTAAGP